MRELITIQLVTESGEKIIQEFAGIRLHELAAKYYTNEAGLEPVFARVDDRGWDMLHRLNRSCRVEFMDMRRRLARLTYQRTVFFLYKIALHEVAPEAKSILRFPLNDGLLIELSNYEGDLDRMTVKIDERMRGLIADNAMFRRDIIKREDVLNNRAPEDMSGYLEDLFRNSDMQEMFRYSYGDFAEYFFDPLMESAGTIRAYDIRPYHGNVIIRVPGFGDLMELREYRDHHLLYESFQSLLDWRRFVDVRYIGDLNRKIDSGEWRDLILISEALHEKKIAELADQIVHSGKRVILIAGPSASGKTTFAQRLCIQLRVNGLRPLYMGTDDYFLERSEVDKYPAGKLDFESLDAVDVGLFNQNIKQLLAGETVDLPVFDFIKGSKRYGERITKADPDQPLVIEGIHALNPDLTPMLPEEQKFRIYISPLTALNLDENNRIPVTDIRLLRRMSRDMRSRNRTALETLEQWDSVRAGEEKNIFPYSNEADALFNSALTYELSVIKPLVMEGLEKITDKDDKYLEAERLIRLLRCVESTEDTSVVSNNSILREFLGGGIWVK